MDAWSKTSPGILEGNFNDFGAFSECFHIEKDNELYHTKYCLATLGINLNNNSTNVRVVGTLMFAICIPAVCSSEYFVNFLKINEKRYKNIGVEILDQNCQIEEYISGLETIDWVAM